MQLDFQFGGVVICWLRSLPAVRGRLCLSLGQLLGHAGLVDLGGAANAIMCDEEICISAYAAWRRQAELVHIDSASGAEQKFMPCQHVCRTVQLYVCVSTHHRQSLPPGMHEHPGQAPTMLTYPAALFARPTCSRSIRIADARSTLIRDM